VPLHLFDPLKDLAERIRSGRRVILFTDFDGTLVPICDKPLAVVAGDEVRMLLKSLAKQGGVAVVSGRDLADLCPRVRVEGITYAGNHGLEIRGPGYEYRVPAAVDRVGELRAIVAELTHALSGVLSAWVQNKELTASVHYRQVEPTQVPQVFEIVERVTAPHREHFELRQGKMVLEVRPRVNWHKGEALKWLWTKMEATPTTIGIYLGDDATDEDAFAALPDGVTVLVGSPRPSEARYRLTGPDEVIEFLRWLALR
jgi:trehalose-phosphatase